MNLNGLKQPSTRPKESALYLMLEREMALLEETPFPESPISSRDVELIQNLSEEYHRAHQQCRRIWIELIRARRALQLRSDQYDIPIQQRPGRPDQRG